MTLKQYLQIFGKRIWIFLMPVIAILLVTYIFTASSPYKYSGSLTMYTLVTSEAKPNTQSGIYQYDNYYIFQSSVSLADTVITWLKDPANVTTIYSGANVNLPHIELKKYSKLITAKKNEPANVQVIITSNDEQYVRNLIDSTKIFIENKSNEWKNKDLLKNIAIDFSNPVIVKEKPQIFLNMGIALVVSIILGLGLVYLTEYLAQKD